MSRIEQAFQKKKAFIPFITCGDPSLEVTKKLVCAMEKVGADLIELGIPFSDPTAEGPVIQAANIRLCPQESPRMRFSRWWPRCARIFCASGVHDLCQCGIFLWHREVCEKAVEVGMDGLILPDVLRGKRRIPGSVPAVWLGVYLLDCAHLP